MPKTKISEYSTTNSNNTDIESINIDEGCAPSGINNAIRELMVHLKEFQTGSSGDPLTVAGTFVASGGATIAASAGTSASPSIHFSSDTNTGIFSPAADTIAFSEGGAEAMRIDSSGNLLVGSSTATNNLRELESFGVVYTGGNAGGMALTGYPGIGTGFRPLLDFNRSRGSTVGSMTKVESGDNLGSIIFRGSDGTSFQDSAMISSEVDEATGSSDMPGRLTFWTAPDGSTSVTERMRIDSSGNLLVGTTSQISGTSSRVNILNINEDLSGLTIGNAGGSGNTNCVLFNNSNGIVGTIRTNASATAYNTSSDYRLKNTIAPMTGALAKVALLKPCTYKWNVDGTDGEGFIAHELAEVVPDCVSGAKDAVDANGNPQYQGVDTSFLVATLTAAIQELKAELDTVKAQNAAFEARLAALEAK
jgi:hypothetical protein